MSEIEKLYKNAGIEKREQGYCDWDSDCPYDMDKDCGKTCPYWVEEEPDYPPFTPEKQLEIVKWCCDTRRRYIIFSIESTEHFDEKLVYSMNTEWKYLTKEEREQIRSILNG